MENLRFTTKQFILLVLFSAANLLSGAIYSVQAPLYPQVAEAKNATALEYSIIFGVYEGSVLVTSFFSGSLIYNFGPKCSFFGGLLFQGICTICFGFVYLISHLYVFLLVSFLIRILEGISFSILFSAQYSFIPTEFKGNSDIVMGILEMTVNVGFAIGPAMGGFLYKIAGFYLPFLAIGSLTLVLALTLPFFIWDLQKPTKETSSGAIALFTKPSVLINYLVVISTAIVLTFNLTILEPFLFKTFKFESYESGLVFGLAGLLCGISGPLWAVLAGKLKNPLYLSCIGILMNIIGNILIGPLPITGLVPHPGWTIFGLSLIAIAFNLCVITSFVNASICAKKEGYADDGGTMSIVASCYICSFAFGNMVGAPIGGALCDEFGFRNATYFPTLLLSFMAVLVAASAKYFSIKRTSYASVSGNDAN